MKLSEETSEFWFNGPVRQLHHFLSSVVLITPLIRNCESSHEKFGSTSALYKIQACYNELSSHFYRPLELFIQNSVLFTL